MCSGVASNDEVKVEETVWRHPQMVKRITVIGLVLTYERNGVLCDKLGLNSSYHIRIHTPTCTLLSYIGVIGITQANRSFPSRVWSLLVRMTRIGKRQRGFPARLEIVPINCVLCVSYKSSVQKSCPWWHYQIGDFFLDSNLPSSGSLARRPTAMSTTPSISGPRIVPLQ